MVKIRWRHLEATIEGGRWRSSDPGFQGMLNVMHPHGVSAAWPDPDYAQAKEVVDQIGGEIIYRSPPGEPPEGEDIVY